jgi:multiple RNA-binding domain-containing protein 1
MRPSKTKTWANEDVLLENSIFNTTKEIQAAENESDDEYQELQSGKKGDQSSQGNEVTMAKPVQFSKQQQIINDEISQSKEDSNMADAPQNDPELSGLSDMEWMRRRTNRILEFEDDIERLINQESSTRPNPSAKQHLKPTERLPETPIGPEAPLDAEMTDAPVAIDQHQAALSDILETRRLFVRNLSYTAGEEELRSQFSRFGQLEEVCQVFFISECGSSYSLRINRDIRIPL